MKKIVLAIGALATAAAVQASPYAELAIGKSKLEDADCAGATSCDETDTGYRLTGGWQFTPNLAGELSWWDFGKATANVEGLNVSYKASGLSLGVAGTLPLAPQFNLVGRLGLINIKATGAVSGLGSVSDTNIKPYFGVGLGYELNKQLSLGLNYDMTKADLQGAKSDVSLLSFSAKMRF